MAFTVGTLGFFQCEHMPFGLCNAPATFQQLMTNCLGELNYLTCLVYLDDVVIYSNTQEKHIKCLRAVLKCFRLHRLKLKPSKCEEYLLKTDASKLGLGTVLSYKQSNGRYHPVALRSRALHGAEVNYHSKKT